LRKGVDCVERVGSKSRKVGLEVKSQTPACCVHLAAEVTTIRLFTAVASDVVVVVARGGKALSAHVTGVRFLTSMQTYVVHQADAGREYLITMRALQLLAPSLVADPGIWLPRSGLSDADSPLSKLKQDLRIVFWLPPSFPRTEKRWFRSRITFLLICKKIAFMIIAKCIIT